MTEFEIFSLGICLFVFVLLGGAFTFLVYCLVKMRLLLVEYGEYDVEIAREYIREDFHNTKVWKTVAFVANIVLCAIFVAIFVFSLFVNTREDSFSDTFPTLRVVLSSSMSEKHENNTYLDANGLDDQFSAYDLILTYKIPDEYDIKLFDVVVYEVDGTLVVHRVVGIEEPDPTHPDCRYFTLQGDANGGIDRFPVLYSQMRGIYRGEKVKFVGSIVKFFQSPAGWLCIALLIASAVFGPFIDKYVYEKERERYKVHLRSKRYTIG